MPTEDTTAPVETAPEDHSNNAEAPGGTGTDSKALQLELEAAQLKATQAEMRARQLENERAEAERNKLKEEGKVGELLERAEKQIAEFQQQREMDDLLAKYPPEVQKVAKKLFGAGDLSSQLEAIQEAVKQVAENKTEAGEAEDKQPSVTPMNPNTGEQHQSILKAEMTLDEKADALDKKLTGLGL